MCINTSGQYLTWVCDQMTLYLLSILECVLTSQVRNDITIDGEYQELLADRLAQSLYDGGDVFMLK
jgi:hypothetical protein